jgi:hypothetical protein
VGGALQISPPFVISTDDVQFLIRAVRHALDVAPTAIGELTEQLPVGLQLN